MYADFCQQQVGFNHPGSLWEYVNNALGRSSRVPRWGIQYLTRRAKLEFVSDACASVAFKLHVLDSAPSTAACMACIWRSRSVRSWAVLTNSAAWPGRVVTTTEAQSTFGRTEHHIKGLAFPSPWRSSSTSKILPWFSHDFFCDRDWLRNFFLSIAKGKLYIPLRFAYVP